MENLITIEELSKRIHKSVRSIRNDRVRNPNSIPPAVKFPGSRRLLFLESDVYEHILKFREEPIETNPLQRPIYKSRNISSSVLKDTRRTNIGRPTNKSKLRATK